MGSDHFFLPIIEISVKPFLARQPASFHLYKGTSAMKSWAVKMIIRPINEGMTPILLLLSRKSLHRQSIKIFIFLHRNDES